jgi:hypothetical protein
MVVRVKVRIKAGKEVEETVAAVNSYFETEEPEIILPLALAARLGVPFREDSEEIYRTLGGPAIVFRSPRKVRVEVVTPDRKSPSVECRASVSEIWDEAVLSDKLTDRFGIVILRPGRGLWRFADEGGQKSRRSEKPEYWR